MELLINKHIADFQKGCRQALINFPNLLTLSIERVKSNDEISEPNGSTP